MLSDPETAAEQRLGGGGAKAYDNSRFQAGDFGFEPGAARVDFPGAWFLVNATLSARLPFEMLYSIRHVDFCPVNSGCSESFVQQFTGGADERPPGEIFLISGLLADHHDFRPRGAFAEDDLCGVPPQVAGLAILGCFCQVLERRVLRDRWRWKFRWRFRHARRRCSHSAYVRSF